MTSPFGLPWPTFAALLVVAASIVISILWAILTSRADGPQGGADDE